MVLFERRAGRNQHYSELNLLVVLPHQIFLYINVYKYMLLLEILYSFVKNNLQIIKWSTYFLDN